MALNFCRKINRSIARNCIRFFHENARNLGQVNIVEDAGRTGKLNRLAISSKRRNTQPENAMSWAGSFETESEVMQKKIQGQYLQPATLPSYMDKPIFDKSFMKTLQEEPIKRAQTLVMNNSARFEWDEAMEEIQETIKYYNKFNGNQ